jgi:hypothetical protein
MRKKAALIRALLAATNAMVQGGLSETSRRCGKATCQCAGDSMYRHGPHLYLTYRDGGTNRSLYVPPEHADAARAAHAAWATFWETGCAIAALNRETWRRRWQGTSARQARRKAAGD